MFNSKSVFIIWPVYCVMLTITLPKLYNTPKRTHQMYKLLSLNRSCYCSACQNHILFGLTTSIQLQTFRK